MCKMLPLMARDSSSQYCLRKGLFHDNIDIMLSTEVADIEGEPGKFLVSLNPFREPAPRHVIAEMEYDHPVFDRAALAAQSHFDLIQGQRGLWFCGSYLGYGFHEDAVRAAVQVAESFGIAL